MAQAHQLFRRTLGPGQTHVVLLHHFTQAGAHQPGDHGDGGKGHTHGRKDIVEGTVQSHKGKPLEHHAEQKEQQHRQ